MNRLAIKEITETEFIKYTGESSKALRELEKERNAIKKAIAKLKPQTRLMILNDLLLEISASSNLPPYSISAILDGIKHFFQHHVSEEKTKQVSYAG